jgi:serine/threonine protein kinase
MSQSILNVKSKRQVTINGQQYKKLLKKGYYVENNQLLPPKSTIVITTQPKTVKTKKTVTFPQNVVTGVSPIVTPIPSPKSPVEKVFESDIVNKIIQELEPLDLLSLYLSNKAFNVLDKQKTLDFLCQKFNVPPVTTFNQFIKLYNLKSIDVKLHWLYQLENQVEMPSQEYVNNLTNNKLEITSKMRAILIDWLYEVSKILKTLNCFGLTISILDIFSSQYQVTKVNLQLVGVCCLHLAATLIYEYPPDIADYVFMTDGTYTIKQIEDMIIVIFNTLKGVLIRPVADLFTNDQQLKDVITLSYARHELIIYKPSMIVEAARYLVTGQYKIYTPGELSKICNIINQTVKNALKSSLKSFNTLAQKVSSYVTHTCFKDEPIYKTLKFKYNNDWHIGDYQTLNVLGEGAYGKVSKIKQKCGTELVMKTSIQQDNNEATFLEISSLKLINNNYVVNLCGFEVEWNKSTLYLPLGHGSLHDHLKTLDKNKLTKYMIQIATGVKACHDHDMIHRDLKPQNIVFFQKEDIYKLIDFGLAVPYASYRDSLSSDVAATLWWRAPEALLGDSHYTAKIDIWALGIIFSQMVLTDNLFKGDDEDEMIVQIFKMFDYKTWPGATSLPGWNNKLANITRTISLEDRHKALKQALTIYYDMIMSCLTLNPNNRPTIDEVLVMLNQL